MATDAPTAVARADVAVVGAGAAGLFAALIAAREGARVVLVSRSPLAESASYWAQGGVAAAIAEEDSPELHLADTLAAGRSAARPSAARVLCDEAPARVEQLARLGVRFDADRHGRLALGLEGGHAARRVVHAGGSATGRRITRQLSALVAVDERIEILEGASAESLRVSDGRCVGLLVEPARRRARSGGAPTLAKPLELVAGATILATGGAAALWERTTNPRGAIGAGLTLAAAAGATLADLEFMQFHPTALVSDGAVDGFLVTEAVRGEGALLVDARGERFVDELAPRDEVALAIIARMRADATASVGLDLRALDIARFPNVASALSGAGIDGRRDLVPVAPAAHYTMGGIATDLEGRSSLTALYAVGECGCTGLHGANRLASNSLAECFVFGGRAGVAAAADLAAPAPAATRTARAAIEHTSSPAPPPATRAALWRSAGLERSREGLEELATDPFPLARRIGESALARRESRGAHRRTDFQDRDPELDGAHSIIRHGAGPALERWL